MKMVVERLCNDDECYLVTAGGTSKKSTTLRARHPYGLSMQSQPLPEARVALRSMRTEPSEQGTTDTRCINPAARDLTNSPSPASSILPYTTAGSRLKGAKTAVEWSVDVKKIRGQRNPTGIKLPDAGSLGQCSCTGECYAFQCMNSLSDAYCTTNCALKGMCGNSTRQLDYIRLFKADRCGLGAFTTKPIECGVNIAEYGGILEVHEGNKQWLLKTRTQRSKKNFVYLDPVNFGTIGRFVNHSCDPTCTFREGRYRNRVSVVILTKRAIEPNEELTMQYDGELWFPCQCTSASCIHRNGRMETV
ncbi:SET domain [Phytophthora cactorum]|nr:SET domain [Phytophthora cactorum]